jgi:glutaconate CoA-transferase subunit A
MTEDEVVARLRPGMTIGIGGWGSRRKPMSLVRAIVRSDLKDLTVVSYGGPDVGLLCAAGKVRKLVFGFVSLDSIPLDPLFRAARQQGRIEVAEYDEGMVQLGLYAAATRVPFLPTRVGLGSLVVDTNPDLRMVADPYSGEELIAMPALRLDAALVHMNRADERGNAQFLGPDPYFDDLFCAAAADAYVSCERIVPAAELTSAAHPVTVRISRMLVSGVVEAPNGAHFTSCVPDYERDEVFQRAYVAAAADPDRWAAFRRTFLDVDEAGYQRAVSAGQPA